MIPARPTTYNGIHMRSRLEAKFAAFFDQQGYRWDYEPRCYADAEGQYLPDFQLHWARPAFVEIKGATPSCLFDVQAQMQTVWSSEPAAQLILIVDESDEGWAAGTTVCRSHGCKTWHRYWGGGRDGLLHGRSLELGEA